MELQPFRVVCLLSVFLYEKLKDILYGLYQRTVKFKVLEANTTFAKKIPLDLSKEENLLLSVSVNVGFGAQSLIKKVARCKSERSA